MVRYSKPFVSERKYIQLAQNKLYKAYAKQYHTDRANFQEKLFAEMAELRLSKMMTQTYQFSDEEAALKRELYKEMYLNLLEDEFIAHSIPSYYFDSAELKDFLLQTECIKDIDAIKDFVLKYGVSVGEGESGNKYMSLHLRIPGEKDAYTYMIAVGDDYDFGVVVAENHERLYATYIIRDLNETPPNDLKLLLNLIYYVLAFPDALVDGKPRQAEPDPEHATARKYTLHTDKRVVEREEGKKQHRVTHFRRGHFRRLSSDYYKNKQGQVIFIHASLVKGTAAKTVLG